MPELILKLGDKVVQNYVFDKDVMALGRSRDNDIVIDNLSVSRNHARLRKQDGKYILTDLNSANGTYVNSVKITKTELVDGDVVTIGKHRILFADRSVTDEELIFQAFGADRTVVMDKSAGPTAMFCVVEGKLKGQELALTKPITTVGKSQSNDIILGDDWLLAKRQAMVVRRGSDFEIQDLGNFRKTKINGEVISGPTLLKPGDKIEFGNTRCVFQLAGHAVAAGSGRIPQELGAEDSVFSTGLSEYVEVQPSASQHELTPDEASPYFEPMQEEEPEEQESRTPTPVESMEEVELCSEEDEAGAPREAAEQPPPAKRKRKRKRSGKRHPDAEAANVDGNGWHEAPAESEDESAVESVDEDFSADDDDSPKSQTDSDAIEVIPLLEDARRSSDIEEETPDHRRNDSSGPKNAGDEDVSDFDELLSLDAAAEVEDELSQDELQVIDVYDGEPEGDSGAAVEEMEQAPAGVEAASDDRSGPGPQGEDPNGDVLLWERALQNPSATIRREAAKKLKRLTGKDYAY